VKKLQVSKTKLMISTWIWAEESMWRSVLREAPSRNQNSMPSLIELGSCVGYKKSNGFLTVFVVLAPLTGSMFWVQSKGILGRKLMLDFLDCLCWREDTQRYRQTQRERERAGGKAQMCTHSYRRQMMLEHAVLAFTSISLAIVDWPNTPAYVPLCWDVHGMDHSSSLKFKNLLLLLSWSSHSIVLVVLQQTCHVCW
jgi:hypothetical protein